MPLYIVEVKEVSGNNNGTANIYFNDIALPLMANMCALTHLPPLTYKKPAQK